MVDMRRVYKGVKLISILIVVVSLLTSCSLFFPDAELGLKKTELSGEIEVLTNQQKTGQPIPMVLMIPEELSDLHKEMWSVLYKDGNDQSDHESDIDYTILEAGDFDGYYTQIEIEAIFSKADVPIIIEDEDGNAIYNPKLMIFTPDKAGAYHIEVYGYYKSTSPRFITDIEVTIGE